MNTLRSRLASRFGILICVLVVVGLAGACATRLGAEVQEGLSSAAPIPPTPDASATITANLLATLPPALSSPAPSAVASDIAVTVTAISTAPQAGTAVASEPAAAVQPATEVAATLPTSTPLPSPAATPAPQLELTPDGTARTAKVPILMYHYISTPPAGADVYRVDLSTPPDLFAAQLDRLLAEGYTAISLYQLLANLTQGAPLPEKPVVLTFDDGYRDNYENAFPLLRARGLTATFFVVTDFVDEDRPDYLSWDMAREMLAAGMSIESHGRNHFTLAGQDDDYLVWQALGSLETLQYELGVRPRFVSYPAGDYDQRTIAIFQSANYWAGVTTEQGTQQSSEHPFELERIRMRNTTTPDDMLRYMQADW
jgi:peptidoglycan/xylan/chitin deacetylase (PgdA/CDA1 family)